MTTPQLLQSLCNTMDRAALHSLAQDCQHEFVCALLPLMPEAAGELLELTAGEVYTEFWLLHTHPELMLAHAWDGTLARLHKPSMRLTNPVIVLARAAKKSDPTQIEALRPLAHEFLESLRGDDFDYGEGLLAWASFESPDRERAMTAEAFELAMRKDPPARWATAMYFHQFDAAQRQAFREAALRTDDRSEGRWILQRLLDGDAPDEAMADARQLVAWGEAQTPKEALAAILPARGKVPFELLRPVFERAISAATERREVLCLVEWLGPEAPAELFEQLLTRAREREPSSWELAEAYAALIPMLPAQAEALRNELRGLLDRVLGVGALGHRMSAEEIPLGAEVYALQLCAGMHCAGAFVGDERRRQQERVLSALEAMPTDFEQRYTNDGFPWERFGKALVPALHERAVRAVLAMRYRPSALKALAMMVGGFEEKDRHWLLQGLSRLAEGVAPQDALDAADMLERAAAEPDTRGPKRTDAVRGATPWKPADEGSLAIFRSQLASTSTLFSPSELRGVCEILTVAAAERALELCRARKDNERVSALLALAGAPALAGHPLRAEVLAELLGELEKKPALYEKAELARLLLEVCPRHDAGWSAMLARVFDGTHVESSAVLQWLTPLTPVLRRLGGPELLRALATKLRQPPATPAFARPWAHAALGHFSA